MTRSRQGESYVLTYSDVGSFTIAPNGDQITCQPHPGVPDKTVRQILLDQVLPLILSRQGAYVFHGSAVALPSGAAVFLGKSGQGKSTLAGFLAREQFPLLADDCIVLTPQNGRLFVQPAYPGVRLWGDSLQCLGATENDHPLVREGRTKRRLTTPQFAHEPVPLRRFYFLTGASTPDVEIGKLEGAGIVRQMLESQFVLDPFDERELKTSFAGATAVARTGLCYHLSIPRDFSRLAESAGRILQHAATP